MKKVPASKVATTTETADSPLPPKFHGDPDILPACPSVPCSALMKEILGKGMGF